MKLEDLTPKQRLKAEKWLAIIRECINSDLSNEEWCEQNNVSIKSYYYYLAKLRKMAIEQIPYKKRNNVLPLVPESNDIVEIQAPQSTPVCIPSSVMTICQGNTKIEINSNCPEWMIRELLNKYVRWYFLSRTYLYCLWIYRYEKVNWWTCSYHTAEFQTGSIFELIVSLLRKEQYKNESLVLGRWRIRAFVQASWKWKIRMAKK